MLRLLLSETQQAKQSMELWDHDLCGFFNGSSLSAGKWQGTLAHAHMKQEETSDSLTSFAMEAHQYISLKSSRVLLVPGYLEAGGVWAQEMRLLHNRCSTYFYPLGHSEGTWYGKVFVILCQRITSKAMRNLSTSVATPQVLILLPKVHDWLQHSCIRQGLVSLKRKQLNAFWFFSQYVETG